MPQRSRARCPGRSPTPLAGIGVNPPRVLIPSQTRRLQQQGPAGAAVLHLQLSCSNLLLGLLVAGRHQQRLLRRRLWGALCCRARGLCAVWPPCVVSVGCPQQSRLWRAVR